MTATQRAHVIESLAAGCTLDVALKAARLRPEAWAEAVGEDATLGAEAARAVEERAREEREEAERRKEHADEGAEAAGDGSGVAEVVADPVHADAPPRASDPGGRSALADDGAGRAAGAEAAARPGAEGRGADGTDLGGAGGSGVEVGGGASERDPVLAESPPLDALLATWAADVQRGKANAAATERRALAGIAAELARSRDAEREEARAPSPSPARTPPPDGAPDFDAFREEAETTFPDAHPLMRLYLLQDERLAARGLSRTSPWWRWTFAQFFAARESQRLLLGYVLLQWIVALVGRGGGKSTTLEKLALTILLFTPRTIPQTETWQWPYISVRPIDARRRIYETAKLLRLAYALDVKPTQPLGTYTLAMEDAAGNPVEMISLASTIGNVSGPSTPGCVVDEAAKLQTDLSGANPDEELITSLAETSRARDGWIGVRCSSAWRTAGAHHASIIEGTNLVNFVPCIGPAFIDAAHAGYEEVASWEAAQGNASGAAQIRAFARTIRAGSPNVPTWIANPTIPALRSRQLLDALAQKDEAVLDGFDRTTAWLRECCSMPLALDGAFDPWLQIDGLAEMNAMLARSQRGEPAVRASDGQSAPIMKLRGMRPGDARYAGDAEPTGPWVAPSWERDDVF